GFGRFFSRITTWLVPVMEVGPLILSLYSQAVIKYLMNENKSYWGAYILVQFITINFILKGLQFVQSVIFQITKQTKFDAWVLFLTLGISLFFSFLLIPMFASWGSVWATFISY